MNAPLHLIAYASRRSPDVDDDQIVDDIALPSYRKNRSLEITGCLWFDDEHFLQFIEGPRDNLEGLYKSICADSRHFDVRELVNRPVESRSFARFALQVVKNDDLDPVQELIRLTFEEPDPQMIPEELVSQIVIRTDAALARLSEA